MEAWDFVPLNYNAWLFPEPTANSWNKDYWYVFEEDVLMFLKVFPHWPACLTSKVDGGLFVVMALYKDKVVYIPGVSEEVFQEWFKKI